MGPVKILCMFGVVTMRAPRLIMWLNLSSCDIGWTAVKHASVSASHTASERRVKQIQSHLRVICTPRP